MATKTQVRTRLLATIGVLWLAAVTVIIVLTITSAGERVVRRELNARQQANFDQCMQAPPANGTLPSSPACLREVGTGRVVITTPTYDLESAALQIGGVTLLAGVLGAGTVIWTRSEDDDALPPTTFARPSKSSAPPNRSVRPPVQAPDRSSVANKLRELKALHDDGILTDDEYETKRKALTERL